MALGSRKVPAWSLGTVGRTGISEPGVRFAPARALAANAVNYSPASHNRAMDLQETTRRAKWYEREPRCEAWADALFLAFTARWRMARA